MWFGNSVQLGIAGLDVFVVAPTGMGKVLAFKLELVPYFEPL